MIAKRNDILTQNYLKTRLITLCSALSWCGVCAAPKLKSIKSNNLCNGESESDNYLS